MGCERTTDPAATWRGWRGSCKLSDLARELALSCPLPVPEARLQRCDWEALGESLKGLERFKNKHRVLGLGFEIELRSRKKAESWCPYGADQ